MLRIILPLPPSANRLWRTTKTGGVHRSDKYTQWRAAAVWQASLQAQRQSIKGRYKATFHFVRPDKRKRDLDNLLKAAMDVLAKAEVIENDCLCEWLEARWVAEGPQCLIMLEGLDESFS